MPETVTVLLFAAFSFEKTAEELDIQRSHLYNKIDKFDLERNN